MQFQKSDGFRRRIFFSTQLLNQFAELFINRVHGSAQASEFGASLRFFDRKVRNFKFAFGKHLRVSERGARTHGRTAQRYGLWFGNLGVSRLRLVGIAFRDFVNRFVVGLGSRSCRCCGGGVFEQFVHYSSSPNFD